MPAQKTINPSACVRAYPVVERHRLVWVWPGDPALADPALMPDFHWNDGREWKGEGGTFYSLKCDWRLVVDNLMDLTHETYVHSDSIGHDAILDTPFDVTHGDRTATMTRWMIDIEPPPFWAKQLGKPGRVDRWQIVTFQAPAVVVGDVGVAPAGTGAPQGDRSQGVNGAFLAAIAPETETSCHYFWNFVRTFRTDDDELTRALQRRSRQSGQGRLRPGPCRPGGAAARDRPTSAPALLQSQHRRRRLVGAPHDRPPARQGARRVGPGASGRIRRCPSWIEWGEGVVRATRDLSPDIRSIEIAPCGRVSFRRRPAATSMSAS